MTDTATATLTPQDLVGKFFVSSWGYDQTNIDFYKVVGATAKRVRLQKWSAHRDENLRLVPGEGPHTTTHRPYDYDTGEHGDPVVTVAPVQLKKADPGYQGRPWITLTTYSGAGLWDGTPKSDTYTHGGAGH
jgi:hypothetical protein